LQRLGQTKPFPFFLPFLVLCFSTRVPRACIVRIAAYHHHCLKPLESNPAPLSAVLVLCCLGCRVHVPVSSSPLVRPSLPVLSLLPCGLGGGGCGTLGCAACGAQSSLRWCTLHSGLVTSSAPLNCGPLATTTSTGTHHQAHTEAHILVQLPWWRPAVGGGPCRRQCRAQQPACALVQSQCPCRRVGVQPSLLMSAPVTPPPHPPRPSSPSLACLSGH
jgi:hypothetical protein